MDPESNVGAGDDERSAAGTANGGDVVVDDDRGVGVGGVDRVGGVGGVVEGAVPAGAGRATDRADGVAGDESDRALR